MSRKDNIQQSRPVRPRPSPVNAPMGTSHTHHARVLPDIGHRVTAREMDSDSETDIQSDSETVIEIYSDIETGMVGQMDKDGQR